MRENLQRVVARRQSRQPRVAIFMVILKHTILEVAEFIQMGYDLGVDLVSFGIDHILSFADLSPWSEIKAHLKGADELARSLEMKKRP